MLELPELTRMDIVNEQRSRQAHLGTLLAIKHTLITRDNIYEIVHILQREDVAIPQIQTLGMRPNHRVRPHHIVKKFFFSH